MIIEVIIFLTTALITYFLYVHKKIVNHFDKYGVKYLPPLPIFGNERRKNLIEDLIEIFKAFPNERYVAYIEKTKPIIVIRDIELIKKVTVKDFDHFVDHPPIFNADVDPLYGNSIFMMSGDRWKDMRVTLSPAFTSSKMKKMFPLINDVGKRCAESLKEFPTDVVDSEDLTRRYVIDASASVSFGIEINSLKDEDNEFLSAAKTLYNYPTFQKFALIIAILLPKLAKILKIQLYPKSTVRFFNNILTNTVEYRTKNNFERPDIIQLFMETSRGTLKIDNETETNIGFATVKEELKSRKCLTNFSMEELVSQVFGFFIAAYDATAKTLVYCLHGLAINPELQEKLYKEIRNFKEKNGEISYDNINELKYLDGFFNEISRKWPQAYCLNRKCTKPYELPPSSEGGKPYTVQTGDTIYIPVNIIQNDPQHYPNPEKLDPERFLDENKHKIKPYTFMPFGLGPRNCMGSRLAILKAKLFLYHLVLNFKILKCSKTSDPIVMKPTKTNLSIEGGSFVKFEPRSC